MPSGLSFPCPIRKQGEKWDGTEAVPPSKTPSVASKGGHFFSLRVSNRYIFSSQLCGSLCLCGEIVFTSSASKSKYCKNKKKMKITSKGQVTIPQDLRERFGLLPNTEVEFVPTPDGRELRMLKSAKSSGRGRALVERLRGRGTSKLSTDQLLKMMRSESLG